MQDSENVNQSVDEEIQQSRLLVADIFLQWNDERMKDSDPTSPFHGSLTIEQILNGLQTGLEIQYKVDMIERLGEPGVKDGLLNLYRSYIYGMKNPLDPKVTGIEKLCGEVLTYSLHMSGRGPYRF